MVRSLQRTYKCLPLILFSKNVLGGTNRLSYLSGVGGGLRFRKKSDAERHFRTLASRFGVVTLLHHFLFCDRFRWVSVDLA